MVLNDNEKNELAHLMVEKCISTVEETTGTTASEEDKDEAYENEVEVSEDGSVINTGIFDESIAQLVTKRIDNPSAHSIPVTTTVIQK